MKKKNLIRFDLIFQERTEVKLKRVYLPYCPVKGDSNFDIRENDESYNFHVIDVDTSVINGEFSHGVIYLNNA
jgi:hypothetical protein